jgi:hypothetical protein
MCVCVLLVAMLFGWETDHEEEECIDVLYNLGLTLPTANIEPREQKKPELHTAAGINTKKTTYSLENWIELMKRAASGKAKSKDGEVLRIMQRMIGYHQKRLDVYQLKMEGWREIIEEYLQALPAGDVSSGNSEGTGRSQRERKLSARGEKSAQQSKGELGGALSGVAYPTDDATGLPGSKGKRQFAEAEINPESTIPAQQEINYYLIMYKAFQSVCTSMADWQLAAVRGKTEPESQLNERWFTEGTGLALEALKTLDSKPGGTAVKKNIEDTLNQWFSGDDNVEQERSLLYVGPSGIGKTMFASLLSNLFSALKIVHYGGKPGVKAGYTLVGSYVGQTAPIVHKFVVNATERIVVLDEVYSMNQGDYGQEAVNALVFDMDNLKGSHIIVGTGYKKEIGELISLNQGFARRWAAEVVFESYDAKQLKGIVVDKLGSFYLKEEESLYLSAALHNAKSEAPVGIDDESNWVTRMLDAFLNMCEEERKRFERLEEAAETEEEHLQEVEDAKGGQFQKIVKPTELPPRVLSLMIKYQASSMDHLAKAIYRVLLEVRTIQFRYEQTKFENNAVTLNTPVVMQAILAEAARQSGPLRKAAMEVEVLGVTQFIEKNTGPQTLAEVPKEPDVPFDANPVAGGNNDYQIFLACGRDPQRYANRIWAGAIAKLQIIAQEEASSEKVARLSLSQPDGGSEPKSAKGQGSSKGGSSSNETYEVPSGGAGRSSRSGKGKPPP